MSIYGKEPERENGKTNVQYDDDQVYLPAPPEESTPFWGFIRVIAYWGFSQQGESHIRSNKPCQDRCKVVVSGIQRPVIVAAVADGVGSCVLSHYGAGIAVDTATSYLKRKIDYVEQHEYIDDEMAEKLLREAMQNAVDEVRKAADEMEQLEYSFQSTLTIALYDGKTLFYAHSGDDGLIVLTCDGQVKMATVRMKGEEINSVYPLQAGPAHWQIGKMNEDVQAFVLVTDGVLDSFVRGEIEDNRIYYPFFQPAFEYRQTKKSSIEEVLFYYYDYMNGEKFREAVADDLTMVLVSNQKFRNKEVFPRFDEKEWEKKTNEYRIRRNNILYPEEKISVSSIADREYAKKSGAARRDHASNDRMIRKTNRLVKKILYWLRRIITNSSRWIIAYLFGLLSGILICIIIRRLLL